MPAPTSSTPPEAAYSMLLSDAAHTTPFQCIAENPQAPDLLKTRELAKIVIEQYSNQKQGLKKWRKAPSFTVGWTDIVAKPPQPQKSEPLQLDSLVSHFLEHRKLDCQKLRLPPLERARDNWMDADVTTWGFYAPTSNQGKPNTLTWKLKPALGPQFPVVPTIDREGFATTGPQLHLQRGILRARNRIIQEAPLFVPQSFDREKGEVAQFKLGGDPPLAALMEYFNLCVSLVDITLMQAYYAGYYASEKTGLTFRGDVMGPATGRRVSDKIKWVRALSGNDLNAPNEMRSFNELKAVRNHLAHFDPPCLAVTVDDVAGWLSKMPDLAWLLIKIRTCLGVPISGPIIQMALSPLVSVVPRDANQVRHTQRRDVGYLSSTWGGSRPHCGRELPQVPESLHEKLKELRQRIQLLARREISLDDVVGIVLAQQLSHLEGMNDERLQKQIEIALGGA